MLHRSCKFQETPCQPCVVGEGVEAGSLALGEQMCLPQGQQQKKVQTKVCLLTIKETSGDRREGKVCLGVFLSYFFLICLFIFSLGRGWGGRKVKTPEEASNQFRDRSGERTYLRRQPIDTQRLVHSLTLRVPART